MALRHLAGSAQNRPDFEIDVWQDTETHAWINSYPRENHRTYISDRYLLMVEMSGRIASFIDRGSGRGYFRTSKNTILPDYVLAAPFHFHLQWWLRERQFLIIHAAAVGNENGAALIVGQSGSGKTTTALSCLAAGMDYFGDDYCIISLIPYPTVHSLYNSAKIDADTLISRLPNLKGEMKNPKVPAHALCVMIRQ